MREQVIGTIGLEIHGELGVFQVYDGDGALLGTARKGKEFKILGRPFCSWSADFKGVKWIGRGIGFGKGAGMWTRKKLEETVKRVGPGEQVRFRRIG